MTKGHSARRCRAVLTRRSRAAGVDVLNARAAPESLPPQSAESTIAVIARAVNVVCEPDAPTRSKGNRVNIPEPGGGDRALGPQCGNATELGDASVDPGKSSLFFVRSGLPGIGLSSDRDVASVKRRASRGVRCIGAGP